MRCGDLIPGPGRSPGEGNGNPRQYSCLGNATDRGAWWATVHGVAKSRTWPNDWAWRLSTRHLYTKRNRGTRYQRDTCIQQLTVPFLHTVEYFKIILRTMFENYPHVCIWRQEKVQVQISYFRKVLFSFINTHAHTQNIVIFVLSSFIHNFFQPKVY